MELVINLLEVFLLGIIGGAVPGPILTAAFTEVLQRGFFSSLKIIGRALIAESAVAILVLALFFTTTISPIYFHLISFGGVLMLLYLAIQVWKIEKIDNESKEIFSFGKIIILTLLNGGFWIFWISVCVPKAYLLKQFLPAGHFIFLLIFEAGWLLMTVALAFAFSRFRPILIQKKLVSRMFKLFALILILFAMKTALTSGRFIIATYLN